MLSSSDDLSAQLKYVILPGKFAPDFPDVELHNGTYQLWQSVWKDVFTEAGNPAALVADDFLRQDYIGALHHNRQVIGCHLYTLFNIDQMAAINNRYFSIFPREIIDGFRERNAKYLMTMEFLTVHPEWRKASLGPVLINLGINILKTIGADAAIGPARKKTKVDQMCNKFGFDCVKPNVSRGNLDCDLVALFPRNIKTYPETAVVTLANSLWNRKTDFTGRFIYDESFAKKAA
jgi:hypothetical protein